MELTDNQDDWQSRTRLLLGTSPAERLFRSHVAVIGLGGVGGIAAEMLARSGIGEMTIVDGDVFDATNRNRQIGALISTTGRNKAEAMSERLHDINPDLRIHTVSSFLKDEKDIAQLFQKSYNCACVLDAIDSISPKVSLILYCLRNRLPIVSCMGSGARLDPEKVCCTDISKTQYCGLARAVRQRLRREGITTGLDVIFSTEIPIRSSTVSCSEEDENELHKKSTTGTVSYMLTIFGCHCAAAVIRKIISADVSGSRPDCAAHGS